ncbi:tRNA 4-thiouridine(8) synthase ThiI [bacterium]|nr:tRNA 4-thiouridine(8) synthase ThiI [candidate division CSSED10-310 bacterium]
MPENTGLHRILCRFGELTLKSRPVRREFSRRLMANIRDALRDIPKTKRIDLHQAYLSVEPGGGEIRERLARVFGLVSIAETVTYRHSNLPDIVRTGQDLFSELVAGRTFAVRCRRIGTHLFSSRDVERSLGAVLIRNATVDLTSPEITCRVEIRGDEINYWTDKLPGPGGLPLGTQGRAVCLISGGIDSPVAAWYAMKRGLRPDFLFCNLGGPYQRYGPLKTSKHLADNWCYGHHPAFYEADFTEILAAFNALDRRYWNILLKRFFYRAADMLARRTGAEAIVTGESLGQVSSQTLSNLKVISRAAETLVIRPLIALDKTQITSLARNIGTYEISAHVPEFCNVAVRKPRTRCTFESVEIQERRLPEKLLDPVMENLRRVDMRSMAHPTEPADTAIRSVPANATAVWIATPDDPQPPPGGADMVLDVSEIRTRLKQFHGPVVLDCRNGHLSRDAAAYLREEGVEAYHLGK